MDTTLDGINSTNAFLDDIIIRTKDTTENHEKEIDKTLNRLIEENLATSLHKCEFGLNETIWSGYQINSGGINPLIEKKTQLCNWKIPKRLNN